MRIARTKKLNIDKAAQKDYRTRNTQGLVIDLRSNPGELVDIAIQIADVFIEDAFYMNHQVVQENDAQLLKAIELLRNITS